MRILAFDTATERGTAAVGAIDATGRLDLLSETSATVDSRHGETLLGLIEEASAKAGVEPRSLGLIAVGLGPGSFTGVRVGVATAKGLALALGVPLVGVSTLDVVAAAVPADDVVAILDAKRGEVFAARFQGGRETIEPLVGSLGVVARALADRLGGARPVLVGRGARASELAALGELADPALDAPRAAVLARLAHARFVATGPSDLAALAPRYVRGADVTTPAGHGQAG